MKHFRGLGESSKHFNLQETAANSWTRTNILLQVLYILQTMDSHKVLCQMIQTGLKLFVDFNKWGFQYISLPVLSYLLENVRMLPKVRAPKSE